MKRRDFLGKGVVVAGSLAAWPAFAQPETSVRAAVVIGVDKAGRLPVLNAAASGARMVAQWLQSEGFAVTLLVDDKKPVEVRPIYDTVSELVKRGTIQQLVVYFSGHGYISGYSEYWLLSGAPENPNEAISHLECVELARLSGIPNVVFISDACRSRSDSLGVERVRGGVIFPSLPSAGPPADVDVFLATLLGTAAYEVKDSVAIHQGIYTGAFLDAFQFPDDTMVRTLNGVRVVPNNQLKGYLEREVPKRAQAKSIRLNQTPDTRVMSGEKIYIGRAATVGSPTSDARAAPSIRDVVGLELSRVGAGHLELSAPVALAELGQFSASSGYVEAKNAILTARAPSHFETRTGFSISGARVEAAACHQAVKAEVLPPREGDPFSLVRVDLGSAPAASVAVRFTDGSGAVLCALNGYIGSVVVDQTGVSNVSYVPSQRWGDYGGDRTRLQELHAVVATAARFGVFRIEGPRETRGRTAEQLADRIRVMKSVDPTLGIYAAYAYSDAGLVDKARSVYEYMSGDLQVEIFDVAMLAGRLSKRSLATADRVFPICPMLSQGWELLRVKDVTLLPEVEEARNHRRNALWTTFDPDGMRILIRAFERGKLR